MPRLRAANSLVRSNPSAPDLVAPVGSSEDLLGQIAVEVAHEAGELESRRHGEEEVVVVGHEDEVVDGDLIEPLGAAENA